MQRSRRTRPELDARSTTTRAVLRFRRPKQLAWRGVRSGGSSRPSEWLGLRMWASSLQGIQPWKLYLQDGRRWKKTQKFGENPSWRAASLFEVAWRRTAAFERTAQRHVSFTSTWSWAILLVEEIHWVLVTLAFLQGITGIARASPPPYIWNFQGGLG